MNIEVPEGYEPLARAFKAALDQAAYGKGDERHAGGLPFRNQPIMDHINHHGVGFATGQAEKKITEAHSLPADRATDEVLGAMVYLGAAWLKWPSAAAQKEFDVPRDELQRLETYDGPESPPE